MVKNVTMPQKILSREIVILQLEEGMEKLKGNKIQN